MKQDTYVIGTNFFPSESCIGRLLGHYLWMQTWSMHKNIFKNIFKQRGVTKFLVEFNFNFSFLTIAVVGANFQNTLHLLPSQQRKHPIALSDWLSPKTLKNPTPCCWSLLKPIKFVHHWGLGGTRGRGIQSLILEFPPDSNLSISWDTSSPCCPILHLIMQGVMNFVVEGSVKVGANMLLLAWMETK